MRTKLGLAMLASFAAFGVSAPAQATISEALSLSELVGRADLVLLVTCVDEHAERDTQSRIVTDYTLQVEETIKGQPGPTVVMRRLGGVLGDLGMRVEGEPSLTPGERYLVFLRRLSTGVLRPVGMSQGVMPVVEHNGVLTVQPGGAGLALRQRVQGGALVDAPPALLHDELFERLRARIDALVPATSESEAVRP